jgi:hypothetical protein
MAHLLGWDVTVAASIIQQPGREDKSWIVSRGEPPMIHPVRLDFDKTPAKLTWNAKQSWGERMETSLIPN